MSFAECSECLSVGLARWRTAGRRTRGGQVILAAMRRPSDDGVTEPPVAYVPREYAASVRSARVGGPVQGVSRASEASKFCAERAVCSIDRGQAVDKPAGQEGCGQGRDRTADLTIFS